MKWNVGFIGFGMIGKVHALAYRSLPFYYDRLPGEYHFRSVATSQAKTASAAQERFAFERATTDWREIIDDPSIHIVHIAQPNVYHKDVLLAAMEAGKHIYCEKPLTATWPQALEVQAALATYSGISQMCLQNRFFAATSKAVELRRQGFLGEILCFRGAYLHSGILDREKVLNWKATTDLGGGGVINDLGPHIIDLLQLLCGEFQQVFANHRITFRDRKVTTADGRASSPTAEDHAVLVLELPNGVSGSAEVSKVATGTQDELRLEIHGSGGALRFNLMSPYWLEIFNALKPEFGWQQIPAGGNYGEKGAVPGKMAVGWTRAHIHSLYNFLTAVSRGEPTKPDLRDGVQLQAVLEGAYRSAERGVWCSVPKVLI